MIVDTSALVALLRGEPEALGIATALYDAPTASMSAATVLESALVLGPTRDADLDAFLVTAAIDVRTVDVAQLVAARAAHRRYGRGSGHPAHLNFGDCFSYALAKVTGEPLLYKSDGFARTDVTPAL